MKIIYAMLPGLAGALVVYPFTENGVDQFISSVGVMLALVYLKTNPPESN